MAGNVSPSGQDTVALAGGQSLVPMLRSRRLNPSVVVDIAGVGELDGITRDCGVLEIGALCNYGRLGAEREVIETVPMLASVVSAIGDPALRWSATLGGGLALGDPRSDLATVMLVVGADIGLASHKRPQVRWVPAQDFYLAGFKTAASPDELIVGATIPESTTGWSYKRFARRSHDWPVVSAAAVAAGGSCRVALCGMGSVPLRAWAVEEAMANGASPQEAAKLASEGTNPSSDHLATADFRRHIAEILVRRAISEAVYT